MLNGFPSFGNQVVAIASQCSLAMSSVREKALAAGLRQRSSPAFFMVDRNCNGLANDQNDALGHCQGNSITVIFRYHDAFCCKNYLLSRSCCSARERSGSHFLFLCVNILRVCARSRAINSFYGFLMVFFLSRKSIVRLETMGAKAGIYWRVKNLLTTTCIQLRGIH